MSLDTQLEEFLRLDQYEKQISDYAFGLRKRFVIDFMELATYARDYAHQLQVEPDAQLEALQFAFSTRLNVMCPGKDFKPRTINIGFRNFPETVSLRELYDHIGRLVNVRGVVMSATVPYALILRAAFQCRKCSSVTFSPVNITTNRLPPPEICPKCRSHVFDLIPEQSEHIPAETVTLQELPDDAESSKQPANLTVRLLHDLVDKPPIGGHVQVTAIPRLHLREIRGGFSANPTTWLDSPWIEDLTFEALQELTDEDIEKIKDVAKDAFLERRMIASICPSLYGMEHIKQAVLYQMLGGIDGLMEGGSFQRGFINILVIGDPGIGKSTLGTYVAKLVPHGHYSSAVSSTGKGLTCVITKDENSVMELKIGAVVMASGSVCVIDEFEKARVDDRVAFHECMEKGTISIDKGGFSTQLKARTAILALGNPKSGRYDPNQNITANINLPPTLLSRFDLIFTIRDIPDPDSDKRIVEHILNSDMGGPLVDGAHDYYETPFLQKFIMYARRQTPEMSQEAKQQIQDFYLQMRGAYKTEGDPLPMSPRQAGALKRLSQARAKLHLREHVLKEDVITAWGLLNRSLLESGIDVATGKLDIDTIETGKPASKREKFQQFLITVAKLEQEHDTVEIGKLVGNLGANMSEYEVREFIEIAKRDSLIFEPKPGHLKRTSM